MYTPLMCRPYYNPLFHTFIGALMECVCVGERLQCDMSILSIMSHVDFE